MDLRISSSVTDNAMPSDSLRHRRIHLPASGLGILRPKAIVWGFFHSSTSTFLELWALTTGAQPLGWTATSLGLFLIHPIFSRIENIFHIPTSPTPPPTGYTTSSGT